MLRPKLARWCLAAVGLIVVAIVGWTSWQAWLVNRDLEKVVEHADAFRTAVEAGDDATADRELRALREASAAAADRTSGPTWAALSRAPLIGDDARGVQVAAEVVDGLARDGLDPLLAVRRDLDGLLPRDGAVPVDAVAALHGPVAEAEVALRIAEERMAAEDPEGFTGRLREKYVDLQAEIVAAHNAMESAVIATDLLPSMLGDGEERHYLLVFQNNAEIRATGGLPGAVALVRAHDGRLELGRQASGADFNRAEELPLPLTPAERRLYDDVIGAYFLSSNMTPDVPRAAALWAARWEQVFPREAIDGVITLDTVAISYLLDKTGSITVSGTEITGDNVLDEVLHGVYLRLEDPREQDEFFAELAEATFGRFTAGADDPIGLLSAVARATTEGRIALHSFDQVEQSAIAGSAIAGEFVTEPTDPAPQIDVTINDTTGAKMSYYLRYDVDVKATYCVDGVQGFTASADLTSVAPADAANLPDYVTGGGEYGTAPGNQLVTIRIFGPAAGSIDDLTLNNQPLQAIEVDQDSRPVNMFYLEMEPGQTYDLSWTMESGPRQVAPPRVRVTPSIYAGRQPTTVGAC